MDKIEKKKKEVPDPRTGQSNRTIAGLLGALFVCFSIYFCVSYLDLATPGPASVLYTLTMHMQVSSDWAIRLMALLTLGVFGFAAVRRTQGCLAGLVLLVSLLIGSCGALSMLFDSGSRLIQTISYQDHLYHLVFMRDDRDSSSGIRYVVIECDSWGLACGYAATPYDHYGNWDEIYAPSYRIGQLVVNTDTQQLVFQRLGETVPIRCCWEA